MHCVCVHVLAKPKRKLTRYCNCDCAWRGIKFGALADRPTDRQIKNPPIFNTRIYVYGIDTWPAGPPRHSHIIMGVVDLGQVERAHGRGYIAK